MSESKTLKHLKDPPRLRSVQLNTRVTEAEFEQIEKKAKRYAKGNVSEWVRYAAVNHTPSEKELA